MKTIFTLFCLCFSTLIFSQDLDYYFETSADFNPAIPKPEDVIHHKVGEWHVTHDRLVNYMSVLAEKSPRMQLIQHGYTHEKRPLIAVIVSSEKNINNLETLRNKHLNHDDDAPVVIWQGYSIHGNEASGSNAALLYAYYLAASTSTALSTMLDDVIIILYPSFNPDGMQRFSTWVNSNKNKTATAENADREYDEVWPGGRTNHYHFDLNRDWLPLTQPESQAKNKLFHHWMPNILTDHHEMGKDATYFFQPGVPERTHPLTPGLNQELTQKIGQFHAEALDQIGSLYYSKESFDDFYYGKGSTFPDIQGSVGILFEQASSRGHIQNTVNGVLTFPFTIKNQLTTSFSTLKAGYSLRNELKAFQKQYSKPQFKGGIKVGVKDDYSRLYEFSELLNQHGIKYNTASSETIDGKPTAWSLHIPYNQPKGNLARAMFDTRTTFKDSIFYDVSAFNLAQAFNFIYEDSNLSQTNYQTMPAPKGKIINTSTYGYILPWEDYYAPKALFQLLKKGLKVKVAEKPFTVDGNTFNAGSLLIPKQLQTENVDLAINSVIEQTPVSFYGVSTGNSTGINLGSNYFNALRLPKIALAVGGSTSSYDSGEIWHYLDVKLEIPVTKIDMSDFSPAQLSNFNVFILPDGYYRFSDSQKEDLSNWVKSGGLIVGYENGATSLINAKLSNSKLAKIKRDSTAVVNYIDTQNFRGSKVTGGAIVEATIDNTHPLFYGYNQNKIALFKRGNNGFDLHKDSFKNPVHYSKNVLLNGYLHEENAKFLSEKGSSQITALGRGRVITHLDNMNFRAFWLGTDKITANSIFFGHLISSDNCL